MALQQNDKTEKLRRRAEVLARPRDDSAGREKDVLEIMPFRLGEEIYGIELPFIKQVYPMNHYTPVPGTPDFVLGISYVQGQVFSVLDLKRFFSLPSSGLTNLNKLIVLKKGEMCFGILADEVFGTQEIPESSLGDPANWQGTDSSLIKGVTTERLILFDADELINHPSFVL